MTRGPEERDDVRDGAAEPAAGPAPSGPAPIIDLGEDAVPVRPARPLGPRRLARLQRELAERARELEEAGGSPDPDLSEGQRRFAELAARTEITDAPAGTVPAGGTPVPPPPAAPHAGPGPEEPVERITVVFPDAAADGPDGHVAHDPVHVDPALFGNRLAPEDPAAPTHIEIVAPGGSGSPGSHAAAVPPAPEDPGDAVAPPPAPAAGEPSAGEEPAPPAAPVPATAAGGLELLGPREHRRRPGGAWPALLLLAVLAALVVVLVLFGR